VRFELIDSGWDWVLDEALAADHSELRIICPFIKLSSAERLLRGGRPRLIQVITRFHLGDFCDGVNDTSALRLLLKNGAKIRGVRNLHAKLYLFGERRVIVTSANLTDAALTRNHEFGFVAEDRAIVDRCRVYFENLWGRAGVDLDEARIDGWETRLDDARARGARPSDAARLPDEGVDAGVPLPPVGVPLSVAEAPQAFVKFFGESVNRAARTVPVMDEVKRSGCHWACTYPRGKRPRQVGDGAAIFMGRLVKKPDDIIVYGRAVAMRHEEGRDDATPADLVERPWKENWPHYIRVHYGEFVAGRLANGISLNELMEALGSGSFATTKWNAEGGSGNVNPRSAYLQQPSVKLSDEGFHWLNERLEAAFQRHGKIAPTELERLDWPELPSVR
jgi:hypothetical protein